MELMYSTAIQIHFGIIVVLMGIIGMNVAMILLAVNPHSYARRARIAMPLSVMLIASVLFTGIIMMAAKQLDFTIENSAMILVTIGLTIMESERYFTLKRTHFDDEDAFATYQTSALRVLVGEMGLVLLMTLGMVV